MTRFDPIAYINEPRWQKSRLGLERIGELLERMGRPQDRLRFVHVAGTNGKGSVCAYLDSILRCAGYRAGMFTSPYVMEFEERIRVDGRNISDEALCEVTLFVRGHAEAMAAETGEHPTEFELMTAVAFEHFAREGCEIVVCEVGLGGRLDSTNVIAAPEVCVITRIGLDHTDLLGSTLAQIAREKAGIIKAGAPVVSWPQEGGALREVELVARAYGDEVKVVDFSQLTAGVVIGGRRGFVYRGREYATRLLGSYQPANATLAIETAGLLREAGWRISEDDVKRGVEQAVWPGRFEIVSSGGEGEPCVVVDGGHNPQGAAVLADSLRDVFSGMRVVFVMGVLADKDYRGMICEVAPLAEAFVCVTPPNPRALPAPELARALRECGVGPDVDVVVADGFREAFALARNLAGDRGVVCAFGSLYSLSEAKAALQ